MKASRLHRYTNIPRNLRETAKAIESLDLPKFDRKRTLEQTFSVAMPSMEIHKADLTWLENQEWDEHYLVSLDFLDILERDEVRNSLKLMCEQGLVKLPHKRCLVEYHQANDVFCLRFHEDEHGKVKIDILFGDDVLDSNKKSSNLIKDFGALNDIEMIVEGSGINFAIDKEYIHGFAERAKKADNNLDTRNVKDMFVKFFSFPLRVCSGCLLAITGIRGLGSEEVQPHKGQIKKAKKSGITPPSKYRTLKVLYSVNKKGEKVKFQGGSVKTMHIRSAHLRNQRYGPGLSEIKQIYIKATIVNYDPSEEVPVRTTHIK